MTKDVVTALLAHEDVPTNPTVAEINPVKDAVPVFVTLKTDDPAFMATEEIELPVGVVSNQTLAELNASLTFLNCIRPVLSSTCASQMC